MIAQWKSFKLVMIVCRLVYTMFQKQLQITLDATSKIGLNRKSCGHLTMRKNKQGSEFSSSSFPLFALRHSDLTSPILSLLIFYQAKGFHSGSSCKSQSSCLPTLACPLTRKGHYQAKPFPSLTLTLSERSTSSFCGQIPPHLCAYGRPGAVQLRSCLF